MKVQAEGGEAGAACAAARGDVVVVVDALRASVSITAALAAGAQRVIPVQTVEQARAYCAKPGFLVAGERGGVQVPGFDYGNSPSELLRHADQLARQALVLTTSNGTRCIEAARRGASAVLAGSLPNADAVIRAARHLASARARDVTLVAAGTGNGESAVEDDLAVAILAAKLAGQGTETEAWAPAVQVEDAFREGPNGRRLRKLGYGEDVVLCARLNVFDVVGVLEAEGFVSMGVKASGGDGQRAGPGPDGTTARSFSSISWPTKGIASRSEG
jgi:2-phosphosulfolactate phosphatase